MAYQIITLIIMAIFYGCYFVKMFCQKKKGIQTDHMGKGKEGSFRLIEVTLKIATCMIPFVELISVGVNRSLFPTAARIVGAVLGILGVAVFMCSVTTMRDSWRAGVSEEEKTEFVTEGIYQISRNPAFLGFDLVYIGIFLMFSNWILLAITVFAILMLHMQIVRVEEKFLVTAFGEEYIAYCKKVNRYFGRKS